MRIDVQPEEEEEGIPTVDLVSDVKENSDEEPTLSEADTEIYTPQKQEDREGKEDDDNDNEEEDDGEENRRRAFEQMCDGLLKEEIEVFHQCETRTGYSPENYEAKRKAAQVQTGGGVSREEEEEQEDRYLHRLQNHSTDLQQHHQQQHQQQQQQHQQQQQQQHQQHQQQQHSRSTG
ncbi:hypothetical protein P5V15_015763 [Pogonomyrmex californicus]